MQWFLQENNFGANQKKVLVKKGSKRDRKGNLMQDTVPNQVIWKRPSTNVNQEALETTTAMWAFLGEKYDFVTSLNKEIEVKEK